MRFCLFFTESCFYLSLPRNKSLDAFWVMVKVGHFTIGMLCIAVPIVSFPHLNRLYSSALATLSPTLSTNLSAELIKRLTNYISLATIPLFLLSTIINTIKWTNLIYQCVIYVYHCVLWIKKCKENYIMYRSIYILVNMFNEVYKATVISFKLITVAVPSLALAVALIHGTSFLSVGLSVLSIIYIVSINFTMSQAKLIYVCSEMFLYNIRAGKSRSNSMRKTVASLRECRIQSGSLYFIDSGVMRKTNHAIVENTINNVLMFK